MATYKVILREKKVNKIGQASVYIQYGHQEKTILISTKVKVEPQYFSQKAPWINRVRSIKKVVANDLLIETLKKQDLTDNNTIAIKESEVKQKVQTLLINQGIEPTIDKVRSLFKPENDPEDPEPAPKKIIDLYVEFLNKEVEVRDTSFKHFKVTKSHLTAFLEKTRQLAAPKEVLTYTFINAFNQYLIKQKNQSPGTANNHIKRLKRFATWIVEGGKKTVKDVSLNKDRSDKLKKIFLEAEELVKLYNFDLSDNPRLGKVRDLFVLSCCTGLRYSDAQRITKDHIKKDLITITHLKNDKTTEIPVFLFAKDLIEKYNGDFPKITNQKMNDYLKELLELVEIDEPIIIPVWRGKEREADKVFKKYELISTHHAKKTFCMLCVDNNMPIETLASITGNDEKTLKHYYEIRPEKKRKHLLEIEQSFKNLKVS